MEIAFYGKGGIGKSTISSNISASLGKKGGKVLQLGCDPKQDSTRLLLEGEKIRSVLEYIKDENPLNYSLDEIIYKGIYNIHCIEAGGPEPGVGCAGRGILTTFELLDKLGIDKGYYDAIIYDVLGDVVCGGFAVPMRKEYAKKIYIVTSGEFMSIYAANNILKGINNYHSEELRAGGLIYNSRGLEEEDERMERFSKAVDLPIIAKIPRSELFAESEKTGQTIIEKFPKSELAKKFDEIANEISIQKIFFKAKPLDDYELEEKVLLQKYKKKTKKNKIEEIVIEKNNPKLVYSKNLVNKEPLHGCAFSGACGVTTQIRESMTLAHGPNSCSHITYQNITSLARKTLIERGISLPIQTAPQFYSSDMDENVMIFGGTDNLLIKVEQLKLNNPKVIFIITTCPSGIIGDNIESAIALSDEKTLDIISKYENLYRREINEYKENLRGKKVFITSYNQSIDWILKTIIDLEMDIEFLGVLNFSQEDSFKSKYINKIKRFELEYDLKNRDKDLFDIKPDILISNYSIPTTDENIFADTIPLSPLVGFMSGIYFAKRWSDFFKGNLEEGWKNDEKLFEKYFS